MMVSGSLKKDDGDHDGEPDLAKGLWRRVSKQMLDRIYTELATMQQ